MGSGRDAVLCAAQLFSRQRIIMLGLSLVGVGLGLNVPQLATAAADLSSSGVPWRGLHEVPGRKAYVDTPMGQIHLLRSGEGPAVLLLHQTPWFSTQFARVVPHLNAAGFETIGIDTPGFGMSDLPAEPSMSMDDYAANLIAVMDELNIQRAAVIGHHTGASTAAALTHRYGNRICAAVLHGVPLYTPEQQAERLARLQQSAVNLKEDGSHLTEYWDSVRARSPEKASSESMQWSLLGNFLAGSAVAPVYSAVFRYDMERALREIDRPVLIISNSGDSLHASSLRAVQMRPDFSYVEFDAGTAHFFYDNPVPWSAAVIAFLAQVCQ